MHKILRSNKYHMNDDSTNLDRLNDLALPPEVPWLPPASGWYIVLACFLLIGLQLCWRAWTTWKADAYRRESLRHLSAATNVAAISEILRRTALAVAPRSAIAELSGAAWPDWLSQQCPEPLPEVAKRQLTAGVHGAPASANQADTIKSLREYASHWILYHQARLHANTDEAAG